MLMVCLAIIAPNTSYAHPPSKVDVSYDKDTRTAKATIMHSVADPSKHFIKEVDVIVKGKKVTAIEFTKQDTNTTQAAEYVVEEDLKPGDVIEMIAFCSIAGSRSGKVVVR